MKYDAEGYPITQKGPGKFATFLGYYMIIVATILIIIAIVSGALWDAITSGNDDDKPDHGCKKTFSLSGEENQRYEDCVDDWYRYRD